MRPRSSEMVKAVAYGLIEGATLGKGVPRTVCGERVRFPARWSRYYPSVYEPDTFAFLREHVRPGSVALDVGAHIGLFTVLLARLVGSGGLVVSFEPSDRTRAVLTRTVRLNGCARNVIVRGEAVSQQTGSEEFYDLDIPGCNANSLIKPHTGAASVQVSTVSIDDVSSTSRHPIGCLKIDVEGAELDALRGAAETVARYRPVVSLGVHPGSLEKAGGSLTLIWETIERYQMSVFHKSKAVTRTWFESQHELFDVQLLPR